MDDEPQDDGVLLRIDYFQLTDLVNSKNTALTNAMRRVVEEQDQEHHAAHGSSPSD